MKLQIEDSNFLQIKFESIIKSTLGKSLQMRYPFAKLKDASRIKSCNLC